MSEESKELELKISTTADLSGAKAVEQSLAGIAGAGKEAGHSLGGASKEVREIGHQFHEAAGAGRVVAEVIHGNVSAIGHLGVAVRTIGTLLRTNLIGTLVTLGAVAAQVILPMVRGFEGARKAIEDAAKASEKLAKTNLDALTEELRQVGQGADDVAKKFGRAQAAKEKLDNAEKAARLAEVRANPNLTEVEKATAESKIGEEFRQRDADRRLAAEANKVEVADRKFAGAELAAKQPARELTAANNALEEISSLAEKFKALDEARLAVNFGEAKVADVQRATDLTRELKGKSRPTKGALDEANERVLRAQGPASAAGARTAEAEAAARDAREDLAGEQNLQKEQLKFTKRERAADFGAALSVARGKDQERVGGFRSAQEKINQSAADEQRLQQDLEQLKDEANRRTGLSSDPANADIAESIKKKQAEISAAKGQRSAAQSAFDTLTKDAPKSLLAESQKPAIDAALQVASNEKQNTAAVRELISAMKELPAAIKSALGAEQSSAAPAASDTALSNQNPFAPSQPGEAAPVRSSPFSARPGGRSMVNGAPVAEAIAALNSGAGVIRKDSAELAEAHKKFADEVLQSRQDLKASLDRSRQQAANQREQGTQ